MNGITVRFELRIFGNHGVNTVQPLKAIDFLKEASDIFLNEILSVSTGIVQHWINKENSIRQSPITIKYHFPGGLNTKNKVPP